MKYLPTQLVVGLGILLVGGGLVGGEYYLVNWLPKHKEAVATAALAMKPYKNDSLGIEMKVAAGINEKVEPIFGGVRMFSPRLWSKGPSLTIVSQPNLNKSGQFTPQDLAIWQTDGVQHNLPRYEFEHGPINDRDAVLIWQYKNQGMLLTGRFISPDRIVEVNCTPGGADESLYMQACDESVRSVKVAGPPTPPPPPMGGMEILTSPTPIKD